MDQSDKKSSFIEKISFFLKAIQNIIYTVILIFFLYIMYINTQTTTAKSESISLDKEIIKPNEIPALYNQKKEILKYIDIFKNYKTYKNLNIRIPRGILLVGSPGNGKTFIMKSIAVHNNINFHYCTGADFSHPLVGQGRIFLKNLINEALKKKPCIVFIDEIDALGGNRSANNNDTVSQEKSSIVMLLCSFLDGFNQLDGLLFVGATNRVDLLDNALIRKGRFDLQINFENPTRSERSEIIKHYIKKKIILQPFQNEILETLLDNSVNYSNAETEALINEICINIISKSLKNKRKITNKNIKDLIFKTKLNTELGYIKKIDQYDKDLLLTLKHEIAHAFIMRLMAILEFSQNPNYISIQPRSKSLGITVMLFDEKKHSISFNEIVAQVMIKIAGHISEVMDNDFPGNQTIGAISDFESITHSLKYFIQSGIDKRSGMLFNLNKELNDDQLKRINEFISYIYEKTTLIFENKELNQYYFKFVTKLLNNKIKEYHFTAENLEDFVPSNKKIKNILQKFWKENIIDSLLLY